jgi:dienelactone hydrolase
VAVALPTMSRGDRVAAKHAAEMLARPGPHPVLRGDLALVGLPGTVYTPQRGLGLPAVAFGRGWLQPASRYDELLHHLASWGIVAACPDTQRGVLPSHRQYAADLRTTLDLCTRVRLGDGEIGVAPDRLGLVGHSMGGGCAVLAAAGYEPCRAVVTLALSETRPAAVDAAPRCHAPALHLAAGKDRIAPPVGHAEPVAAAWAGPVQLRTLPKASHLGFTHGRHWSDLLLDGGPETATRRVGRAFATAFLLRHLTGATEHDALLDTDLRSATLPALAPT